ncbi:MAG: hypothetical protein WKF59_10265 [Chitinophagaceae bacterium]
MKKIISRSYNIRMKLSKLTGMGMEISTNAKRITPRESFYKLAGKSE